MHQRVPSPYIFMSHSSKNNDFTQKLTDDLQAAGFNVWVDLEALRDGDRWVAEIQTGVENCHAVVVVMSRAGRESEWVERETLLALELRKPIFIAKIENVPLPLQLITRQFTDFMSDYAAGLDKLKTALQVALNLPAPIPTTPQTVLPPASVSVASPDPNEDNFFAYLAQMDEGAAQARIARDLFDWAKQRADALEFGGRFTPGFHVKVNVNSKPLTVFSLLAYMRNPAVQIPLDYLSKYAPFTDAAKRQAVLDQLDALLPDSETVASKRASRRPTFPLIPTLNSDEALAAFKRIIDAIISALKSGKA